MKFLSFIFVPLTMTTTMVAQSSVKKSPLGSEMPKEGIGRFLITLAPKDSPHSLKELCDMSSLIVEGTVRSSLFPRQLSPSSLETDAVVTVTRAVKGSAPNPDVVVSQKGGTIGKFTLSPGQFTIMQPGEKYLLFLRDDDRPDIPVVSGAKRYVVTGFWSGQFLLSDGKIRVTGNTTDSLRKVYEGLSAEEFVLKVTDTLNSKEPPTPPQLGR